MHAYWYGPKSTTMCAEETRGMEQIQHHQMHKLSLQRSEGEKNHCSNYSMFDISYTTAGLQCFYSANSRCSDQCVQFICSLWQTPKHQVIPPTKDTLLPSSGRRERVIPAASAAVSFGLSCLSFTAAPFSSELIWVRTWILWFSGLGVTRITVKPEKLTVTGISEEEEAFPRARCDIQPDVCPAAQWILSLPCCSFLLPMLYSLQHQCPPDAIMPLSPWWCGCHKAPSLPPLPAPQTHPQTHRRKNPLSHFSCFFFFFFF